MYLQPEVLALAFILVLLYLAGKKVDGKVVAVVSIVFAVILLLSAATIAPTYPLNFRNLLIDKISTYGRIIISFFLLFITLVFYSYGKDRENAHLFALLMFISYLGSILMFEVSDMISLLIVLEIASLPLYALAGFFGKKNETEAAAKYFTFGAVASALFVFGAVLSSVFGGNFDYGTIGTSFAEVQGFKMSILSCGLLLVIGAFGYKIAFFPWQFWAPDAYEGQETLSLMFIGVIPKVAGFLALFRFLSYLPPAAAIQSLFMIVAVLTLFIANLSALVQNNLTRIVAYSSISQAGFMLLAFLSLTEETEKALLLYVFAYGVSNLGLLSVLPGLSKRSGPALSEVSGLSKVSPLAAFLLSVSLLSLAGMPPLPGFFAKVYLFKAVIEAGGIGVVIFAIVMSAVSLGYYLKIIKKAYFEEARITFDQPLSAFLTHFSVSLAIVVFVFYINIVFRLIGAS